MTEHVHTTPTDSGPRYVRTPRPIPTTITKPGKTVRSRDHVVTGCILGTTYAGGRVHHYRVAGDDGVTYLAPPAWLPPDPLAISNAARSAAIAAKVRELKAIWDSFGDIPGGAA